MMSRSLLLLLVLGFGLVACAGPQQHFDSRGFYSELNHYRVPYEPGTTSFLGPEWRVENFRYEDGKPTKPIEGDDYQATFEWTYADGDTSTVSAVLHDLVLSHTTNATIWLRVVPVPHALLDKRIDILAENYVNNLSGSVLGAYFGKQTRTRRVATQILKSESISLLGKPAQVVTFDMADLNQLEMDPNAPRTRVELVLVQTRSFVKPISAAADFKAPGYLLLGYSNDAARFDEQLPAFRRLAQSVELTEPN